MVGSRCTAGQGGVGRPQTGSRSQNRVSDPKMSGATQIFACDFAWWESLETVNVSHKERDVTSLLTVAKVPTPWLLISFETLTLSSLEAAVLDEMGAVYRWSGQSLGVLFQGARSILWFPGPRPGIGEHTYSWNHKRRSLEHQQAQPWAP